ncbi:VWA domain-containing protein [Candidatus Omnitrophota bacterium]
MIFKDPWILLLIPLLIAGAFFYKRRSTPSSVRFSSDEILKSFKPTFRVIASNNLIYLRVAAIILFLLAFARPRLPLEQTQVETEGIDIVLAIDASGSMLAEDFKSGGKRQNRLEIVKKVVGEFVNSRKSDRIGLVAFAARAYTVCPLTLDYDWLLKNLKRVEIGAIEDGTAVGSAIGSSLNRLRETTAKSKIIVLLTDGVSNAGKLSPLDAAHAAKALGIKIYTIGAGTKGPVPYPAKNLWGQRVYQRVKINIDEDTLKKIADETNGKYYRAQDTESLRKIYEEIDELETTPIEESGFQEHEELFGKFLILGLIVLLLEIVLSNTLLRKLP